MGHLTRRQFVCTGAGLAAAGLSARRVQAEGDDQPACTLENDYLRYEISRSGRNLHFVDKLDGKDYCTGGGSAPFAAVKQAGKHFEASAVAFADGRLTVDFGDSGVRAAVHPTTYKHYVTFEVVWCRGKDVEELVFADVGLSLKGTPEEPFAACALALNLKTNVRELPRASSRLRATCYPRFGLAGAKAALIGCPQEKLRLVMQEVVTAAKELPHSPLGGPWALGKPINQGSYLFNFGDMSEERADDWIELARSLGFNQIDFHGGNSFRFGDCRPNPNTYPKGFESLKVVVEKLHAADIAAGLHTYAFFIHKSCPWVTPVPDPRLAKDATFTLATAVSADAGSVPVAEPTGATSTVTGFFVRNSVTLQIDDELITYSGVSKQPPYAFTGCKRGACGTRAAEHKPGTRVHHLKECFGLFLPDGESTLLAEVAARTAEAYNRCGFDMMYLDALDGEDTLGGAEYGWHYGSKYVFELFKRLKKPALMEMSTFHHHLWYVRSRYCAWDHPNRSHKRFIDLHCAANEESRRMFLPGELGWWALKSWSGSQGEPTFTDDIEYLMAKCLGTDTGLALMGINPENVSKIPALPRLADVIKRYEELRHSGQVPERIKAELRTPGKEFTLIGSIHDKWRFLPVNHTRHRIEGVGGPTSTWRVENPFAAQPVRLRIEALMAAGPYDAPENVTLADFRDAKDFTVIETAPGVTAELQPSESNVKSGPVSGRFTAENSKPSREATWAKLEKKYSPPRSIASHQALGLWVHGDGQGEVLNVQLRSPHHISHGIGDHYLVVDFTGWRYWELIEPEGKRYADYQWPYGGFYSIYRERVDFGHVETLGLWYNHLPPKGKATCYLSPIKALPLVPTRLINPAVTIGQTTVTFPVEIESGCYLELGAPSDCKLYGPQGQLIRPVDPLGEIPVLARGANTVKFHCGTPAGVSARARISVISHGQPLS